MRYKKILVCAYTHLNVGDDLLLKILFDRYQQSEFVLITDNTQYKSVFNKPNVSLLRFPVIFSNRPLLRRFLTKLCRSLVERLNFDKKENFLICIEPEVDAVITIGGSIFMQPRYRVLFTKNIHYLVNAVFRNKPRFILGANFGPYSSSIYLENYRRLFKHYTDVCFRDYFSYSLFCEMQNVRFSPDIVFSIELPQIKKNSKTVGFSLIDLSFRDELHKYKEKYEHKVMKLIERFFQDGYDIYLFSFCKYEGDERVINEITGKMSKLLIPKVNTVFYNGDISSFLNVFLSMEIMIPTRFHAMVLSIVSNQRFFPVLYSRKMLNVLEDIHFHGSYTDIKNVDLVDENDIINGISSFEFDEAIQKKALGQFLRLDQFLK